MKNRLQIRYHIPETLPTRAQAMTYLKEAFAVGAANTNDYKSLPGEPLVILYNDKVNELTPAQALSTANVILAIGRGGDGMSRYNNQDYFVIDFAKHEENILGLTEDMTHVFDYIKEAKETISNMQTDIAQNAEDIQTILAKIGERGDSSEKDTVYGYIEGAYNSIRSEVRRAIASEKELQYTIGNETTRATAEEARLQSTIEAEAARAKDAEFSLQNDIEVERDRALAAEEANRDAVENEVARATAAETNIMSVLEAESARAATNEARIEARLYEEENRAKSSESKLASDIHLEYERAFKAEGDLNKRVDDETTRATAAEKQLTNTVDLLESNLNKEVSRAKAEETRIESKLDTEIARATEKDGKLEAADSALNAKVDTEIARATASEKDLQAQLTAENKEREAHDQELQDQITANVNSIALEAERRERADAALEDKINANANRISSNKVKSEGKTIIVTGPSETGTNLEVNVDNRTIVINETGTLSVSSEALVQYKGENAVRISDVIGDTKSISLAVNEGDKILTNDENGLMANLSLKWVHSEAEGRKDEIQLIGKNDTVISSIDVAEFIKDGMLDNIVFDTTDPNNPKLVFTFNTNAGKEVISVSVKELIDVYVAGNGIEIQNNVIAVKVDNTGEHFLTVTADGVKLSGIQTAIDSAKDEVNTTIKTLATKTNTALEVVEGKIVAETNARLENEAKLTTDYKAADEAIKADFTSSLELVKQELTTSDKTLKNLIKTETTARENAVNTLTDSITRLNGNVIVDGSVQHSIFDAAIGSIANTVTLTDATEQSLIKKFTIDGMPYFYTSNSTADMKHEGNALNNVINDIKDNIVEVEDSVEKLEDEITNKVNLLLATMQTTIDALTAKVSTLETELATLKASAITSINGTENEIKVTTSGNTATVGFADDAYFIAGY